MVLHPVLGTITIRPGCCDLQFVHQFVLYRSLRTNSRVQHKYAKIKAADLQYEALYF